jgi:metallophosphoesterase superfamily enzyme
VDLDFSLKEIEIFLDVKVVEPLHGHGRTHPVADKHFAELAAPEQLVGHHLPRVKIRRRRGKTIFVAVFFFCPRESNAKG